MGGGGGSKGSQLFAGCGSRLRQQSTAPWAVGGWGALTQGSPDIMQSLFHFRSVASTD